MRKNIKRIIGLGLILSLTLASLAACGTKDKEVKDNAIGQEDTDAKLKEFLIGGIGPLTGGAASYGISVKQGAEIAVNKINAAGGVTVGDEKMLLKLKFMDDEATVDKAVTSFYALMDDGADVILGAVTTDACIGITNLTKEAGILQLTPSASAQSVTENDNVFRLCFTDPLQGVTMADLAVEELGYTKIAIIYNNADSYSTGMMEAFVTEVEAKGGTIVASESFVTDDVDFNTQLTSIKATDAEIIFVPAYYQDAAYITTQAGDLGMNLPFIGGDGWDGVLAQVVDTASVEGSIFLSPFLATDEDAAVKEFVTEYKNKYNATPDQFAADGYDCVYVFAAALAKAASTESADLIAAMTEINVDGLTGDVTFTEDGEPNKGAKFIEIKDGQYTAR